jgi:hypothetical protein
MCGTLYEDSERIDDQYYHFTGPQQSLYCIGDWAIARTLVGLIPLGSSLGDNTSLRNDIEWARMSDSFLRSIFGPRAVLTLKHTTTNYLYYPWPLIQKHYQGPIQPVTLTVKRVGSPPEVITATWMDELKYHPMSYFMYDGQTIPMIKKRVALCHIFGPDPVTVYWRSGLDVVQPLLISQATFFDGTYDRPIITVEGQGTITYEWMHLLFMW